MKGRYAIFADDDADDLELITGFFKEYNRNINVLEFKDGKEVLKFLDDFSINNINPVFIILDINMPRVNGKETLMTLRSDPKYKHIPVIIYTTSNNKNDEEFCKSFNATWINKPHNIEGIKEIARILADFSNL